MINRFKKHFHRHKAKYFLSIIAVLIFLCCCFVAKDVVPTETNVVRTVSGEEFYGLLKYDYSVSGVGGESVYKPSGSDPQVLIALEPTPINRVKINFSDKYTGRIQIYYTDNMTLSEEKSWISGGISDKSVSIYIPNGNYDLIRLDIENEFSIKSIDFISESIGVSVKVNFIPIIIFLLILITLAIFENKIGFFAFVKESVLSWLKSFAELIKNKKYVFFSFKLLSSLLLASFFVAVAVSGMLVSFGRQMRLAILILSCAALVANLVYYILLKNPSRSKIILIVILLVATTFAFVMPQKSGTAWDDQIHYQRVVYLKSVLFNSSPNEYDYNQVSMRMGSILQEADTNSVLYSSHRTMDIGVFGVSTNINLMTFLAYISYVPLVSVIVLSDALGASYVFAVFLARMFNVVLFALLMYFSVRKLKSGQLIFASVCMIPTLMFSVPLFSYDMWVFAFISFSFATFVSEMQRQDEKISKKNVAIMFLTMIVGSLPKKIYIFLMLPMLFMPIKKFGSAKEAKIYRLICAAIMLLMLLSFFLPFITHTEGISDNRGGEGVSAVGQFSFVLKNPFKYAGILIKFLIDYVSISYSARYAGFFAYLGFSGSMVGTLSILIMLFAAFVDKSEFDRFKGSLTGRLIIMLSSAITLAMVASALYVSFTPVGHSTINGCQWRYIIPILFPGLYAIGSVEIRNNMNPKILSAAVMGVLAFNCLIPFAKLCL